MSGTRVYRMSARAEAVQATRERIVAAAAERFVSSWYDEVTMRAVAADAGVALQTLLNHFGSKEELYAVATARIEDEIAFTRWSAEPGDVDAAVRALVSDYERHGDMFLRTLAVEDRLTVVAPTLELGRREHERWNAEMFAAALDGLDRAGRRRRLAQLVAVTDVYTWKLLRRDKGLGRAQTTTAIGELVLALHTTTTTTEGEAR